MKKDRKQYGTRITPTLAHATLLAAVAESAPGKSVSQADIVTKALRAYIGSSHPTIEVGT